MKIRNMRVLPVWAASGVQGFFETIDRYWYQKLLAPFGVWLWFQFITFVSKTSTLNARAGKMPLDEKDGITPKEWIPRCIYVKWWKRVVLNAVSLSGPGLKALLDKGMWQKRNKDFFVSIMSVALTLEERAEEIRQMVRELIVRINAGEFGNKIKIGIQLNVSCPNSKTKFKDIVHEAWVLLGVIMEEDPKKLLTIVIKLAPTVSPVDVYRISKHERCDGFCLSNTLPYGELPDQVDWVELFGSADPSESPLMKRGIELPGGLSGAPLLPIICNQIRLARKFGVRQHINACGGILGPISAWKALRAGADSVSISTGVMLAPWAVLPAIVVAYIVAWWRENFRGISKVPGAFPLQFRRSFVHE